MKRSTYWLITVNLVLFAVVFAAPFAAPLLIRTPLRWIVLFAFILGISYVAGLIAILLAVWIAFSKDMPRSIKIGNLACSFVTIVICAFFSFMTYSCTHMGGF